MKKILMLCCFVLGISAVSFAQGGGRQRMTPEEQAKGLQTQLKLTDDQTSKITAIYQTQAKSMDSLRTASNGDRQAMMSAYRPIMEANNAKVKALLTAEQKEAFDKMQAERMNRMRQGGGGGNPPPSQK
ncbi:Spy/CpxP family protein refolding chaperone [Mucilaginibacter galii]|nr:Spy/CpxP family protein refolding chaperone [Mucilaginibacter galii]